LQFQNEKLKTAAACTKSFFLFIQSALVDYVSHETLKISNQPTEKYIKFHHAAMPSRATQPSIIPRDNINLCGDAGTAHARVYTDAIKSLIHKVF